VERSAEQNENQQKKTGKFTDWDHERGAWFSMGPIIALKSAGAVVESRGQR
jgi:hypothetical protein